MRKWIRTVYGRGLNIFFLLALFGLLLSSCAVPVRQLYKVDVSLPIGSIQGDSFVGKRYPFKVKIPAGWEGAIRYPDFLVDQGYGVEGLKETPFFLFNPRTQSSIQFDFSSAGRTVRFDQEMIEGLVWMSGRSFVSEVHEEHGKEAPIQLSKAEPVQLKGVPYAARMSGKFTVKGEGREQGWIYAFAEPFQIFILFLITNKDRADDESALEEALSSFEYLGIR
jgi:hypothetical protein